jgi:phosphate transport system substrate-binding protein
MYSKKLMVVLLTIAIMGTCALVLGCTSTTTPSPTAAPTGTAPAATPTAVAPTGASIMIGGSTTVQPLSQILADAYYNQTGVKVTVNGGGSGAGITGVGSGTLDIGSASEYIPASSMATYPNLQTFTIGGSGVCIIVGSSVTVPANGFSLQDLRNSYASGTPVANLSNAGVKDLYTRADNPSGTADSFGTYLFGSANKSWVYANTTNNLKGAQGNPGMISAIQTDPNGLAFVDYGFTRNVTGIQIPVIQDASGNVYTVSSTAIKGALVDMSNNKTSSTSYPISLVRPLNYITNGAPTPAVQAFINYALNSSNEYAYQECGYFSISDIKNASS